jgi:hypothetical protein
MGVIGIPLACWEDCYSIWIARELWESSRVIRKLIRMYRAVH